MATLNAQASDVPEASQTDQPAMSPFLKLPRELRDQIYSHAFDIPDERNDKALCIERRTLKYFKPSAASILLVLRHEYLLLNRQIAREALEVLFKKHVVFFSCGPYVLKSLLESIEAQNGPGRYWLKWIRHVEFDWVTFPNLKLYPPDRLGQREGQHCEPGYDDEYVSMTGDLRTFQRDGHEDEYDHAGEHYDDNFYSPEDDNLYPPFHIQPPQPSNANDPFGFATHYPFAHPTRSPSDNGDDHVIGSRDVATKLDLLVASEVTPLFEYLSSRSFNISTMTVPLYFISKDDHQTRSVTRPDSPLPTKLRYWVQVFAHAMRMLHASIPPSAAPSSLISTSSTTPGITSALPTLRRLSVHYRPWNIWASMNPADDLHRIVAEGVWFDTDNIAREGEGEAFRAAWKVLGHDGAPVATLKRDLDVKLKFVEWDGNVDSWRVGDEVEVEFLRKI